MRIYFDTEFTSLDKDPDLISIGFIAENCEELYVEITDFRLEDCSGFVKEIVLPLLGKGDRIPECMTSMQFGLRFGYWLEQFPEGEIAMFSDHSIDWKLLCEYCVELRTFPRKIKFKVWRHDPKFRAEIIATRQTWLLANPGMEHHALYDARLLKALADRQRELKS